MYSLVSTAPLDLSLSSKVFLSIVLTTEKNNFFCGGTPPRRCSDPSIAKSEYPLYCENATHLPSASAEDVVRTPTTTPHGLRQSCAKMHHVSVTEKFRPLDDTGRHSATRTLLHVQLLGGGGQSCDARLQQHVFTCHPRHT